MKQTNKVIKPIKILTIDNQVLFDTEFENIEVAYKKLEEFQSLGIDARLEVLSISETLAYSLGKDEEDLKIIRNEMEHEISDHTCSDC